MHDFLVSALPVLLPVFTLVNLLLLILLDKTYRSNTRRKIAFCMALVSFGLTYDALILSLGLVLKAGTLLAVLSQLRFVSHGFLIPLLLPICGYALKWKPAGMKKIWVVALVLMLLGLVAGFLVKLETVTLGSALRYSSDKERTLGFVTAIENLLSYAPVLVLIAAGIVVWIKQKRAQLFLSGFFMFLFAALGPATGNFDLIFVITMFGEVLMSLFFLLYAKAYLKDYEQ